MDRKKFLKTSCGIGACSCLGIGLINPETAYASGDELTAWERSFVKNRFAKLIDILDSTLDEETKISIIENLGKECSNDSLVRKYKGNLEGYFKEIGDRWGEEITYDKEKGIIKIVTPERDCVCPFVDSSQISESICHCSVGWQSQTYSYILGKKVKARCTESVIRGSTRCAFEVEILD